MSRHDDELRRHLEAIEAAAGDPEQGLPDAIFEGVSRLVPLVNVDLLIRDGRARTLLTWRDDELFGRGWHVPGGVIRHREPMASRIRACARDELGADVTAEAAPLVVVETIDARRTRGHHISLLFRCHLTRPPEDGRRAASDPPSPGQWRWHDRCPPDLLEAQRRYAPFLG